MTIICDYIKVWKLIPFPFNSTESGWDNPFRPGGDLSREADEIVNLIKGGKPITPTGEHPMESDELLGMTSLENGSTVVDGATKVEVSNVQNKIWLKTNKYLIPYRRNSWTQRSRHRRRQAERVTETGVQLRSRPHLRPKLSRDRRRSATLSSRKRRRRNARVAWSSKRALRRWDTGAMGHMRFNTVSVFIALCGLNSKARICEKLSWK